MAQYLARLKNVIEECNPFAHRRIGFAVLIYAVFFTGVYSISELAGVTTDDTPFIALGVFTAAFVALSAFYNVLGLELEYKGQPGLLSDRFRTTGFIFTRCTGFLIINFIVGVGIFWLTAQAIYDSLIVTTYFTAETFTGEVVLLDGNPVPYMIFGLIWYIFPKWLFNSMPVAYDERSYNPEIKRGLRRAALPAIAFLFVTNFIVASYDFFIKDLIGETEALDIVSANVLSAASVIAAILCLVIALVSAARVSGLSKAAGNLYEEVEESSVEQRAAVSKKIASWKLIPYSDGRFVFYPVSRWNKGYILTADQAGKVLEKIEQKGISFVQLLIIGGIMGGLGANATSLGDALGIGLFLNSVSLILFLIAFLPVAFYLENYIQTKKLKKQFGDLPQCEHPFPSDYFRLRTLTIGFFKIWVLLLLIVFFIALQAMFVFIMIVDGFSSLDAGIIVAGIVLIFAVDAIYMLLLYRQIKFRRLNGRRPQASDLGPIDPQTGRMAKHPFKEPM